MKRPSLRTWRSLDQARQSKALHVYVVAVPGRLSNIYYVTVLRNLKSSIA